MNAVFIKVLDMSIKACWLIVAVILIRLLLKKAPKYIRCILWALVAVKLVFPFSIESGLSLVPEADVNTVAETTADLLLDIKIKANELAESTVEQDAKDSINDNTQNSTDISIESEQENVIYMGVMESHGIDFGPIVNAAPKVWILGVIGLITYSMVSLLLLKRKVKVSMQLDDNIYLCDGIDSPFIMGLIKPGIYLPSGITTSELEYVIAHEKAHLERLDYWWKVIGFLLLALHWLNPLVWVAYILFSRDIELACDELVIKDMSVEDKKAYSTALLYYSVPHKNMVSYPLAFGEIGVKNRVVSILNYTKPAFWITIIAVLACVAVAVFFMTNPKDDNDEAVSLDIMSKTVFLTGSEVYFRQPFTSGFAPEIKYTINNGYLYENEDYDYIGLLVPIDLTKDNFDSIMLSSSLAMGQIGSIIEDNILSGDAKDIIENIRESCKNARIAYGESDTYLLLCVNEEVFYIASCNLDEQGNIASYNNLIRLKADVSDENLPIIIARETETPEMLALQSQYESHYEECVHGRFGNVDFVSSSVKRFPNGDEKLYIEPQKADDEHYFVYQHLEDDSGYTNVYKYKIPAIREPLEDIPEVIIECENDLSHKIIDEYEIFVNNWLGEENGRTEDSFKYLQFNEENTPLFKVPDWTTYRAGQFTLKFPDGQAPDIVDVEDLVLNEDGSVRYKGMPNEVVFRSAEVDRINDVVDFSLADHSSISYYERSTAGEALTEPFYRGYRVRCYWSTTEGLQSVTYIFIIRTQNAN